MTESRPLSLAPAEEVWGYFRARLTYAGEGDIGILREASAFREALAPYMIARLDSLSQDATPALVDDYIFHIHALLLLAEWRDPRAYRPAVAFCRQSPEAADQLFGMFIGELLSQCLASLFDGDIGPLADLATDPNVDEWICLAAMDALTICAFNGETDKEKVSALITMCAEREAVKLLAMQERPKYTGGLLALQASLLVDLGAINRWPLIRSWFDQGILDRQYDSYDELAQGIHLPAEQRSLSMVASGRGYIDSAANAMQIFCGTDDPDPAPEPYLRVSPKIGRNDPCSCRSGFKFKKCCGANV